jgi:hypothetical protein
MNEKIHKTMTRRGYRVRISTDYNFELRIRLTIFPPGTA